MPCWYYEKRELRNTPSIQDNIDYETECRYRQEGARFIISAGMSMNLGYNTLATGVVFFHRFYMFHSFREFPRYVTACCCLFLAGKVEETPKKCRDIIRIARSLLTDAKFSQFREDPREEVLTLERILLQTIKFDLHVEHPYQYLLKYGKCLKGDKAKLQEMVQMAWNFVNDSLCTTLCLQWEPEVMAVALLYLAGKLSKFDIVDWVGRTPKHLFWWDMFLEDVTMNVLEDICHQVLDNFSAPQQNSVPDSPPLPRRTNKGYPLLVPPPNISQAFLIPAKKGEKQQKVENDRSTNSVNDSSTTPPPQSNFSATTPSVQAPTTSSSAVTLPQQVPFLTGALPPPPPYPPYPPGFPPALGKMPNDAMSEKDSISMIPLVSHNYGAPMPPLPPSAIPHAAYISSVLPPPPFQQFPHIYPPHGAFPPPPNYR